MRRVVLLGLSALVFATAALASTTDYAGSGSSSAGTASLTGSPTSGGSLTLTLGQLSINGGGLTSGKVTISLALGTSCGAGCFNVIGGTVSILDASNTILFQDTFTGGTVTVSGGVVSISGSTTAGTTTAVIVILSGGAVIASSDTVVNSSGTASITLVSQSGGTYNYAIDFSGCTGSCIDVLSGQQATLSGMSGVSNATVLSTDLLNECYTVGSFSTTTASFVDTLGSCSFGPGTLQAFQIVSSSTTVGTIQYSIQTNLGTFTGTTQGPVGQSAGPPPTITSTSPSQAVQGGTVALFLVDGANFQSGQGGATVSFSGGQDVLISAMSVSPSQIVLNLAISPTALLGPHNITITNPDGQSSTFAAALSVLGVPQTPQGVSAVVGNQVVYLSWSGTQIAPMGYNVYVNGTKVNPSGLIQGTTFVVSSLQNGQTYQLGVTAVGGGGESYPGTILAIPNFYSVPPHPLHPVLFLHGINSDAWHAWETTATFLHKTLGWTCGGTLYYDASDTPPTTQAKDAFSAQPLPRPSPTPCNRPFSSTGDYFTVDFGDPLANYPDTRGIFHQGDEVQGFIGRLLARKPFSVVAWSMGGLAARSYMQVSDPAGAAANIDDLITLGTPHWGVNGDDPEIVALVDLVEGTAFTLSRGAFDMNGGCAANGDYTATQYLSQFLQSLDSQPTFSLPVSVRYVVVSGYGGPLPYLNVACNQPFDVIPTDLIVPVTSSTLAGIIPAGQKWSKLDTPDIHPGLPDDFSSILCALDQNCLELQVMSPVDIQVTSPNGLIISNSMSSMPGASYRNVVDATGHDTGTVLIPFPKGGQYSIAVTPKPGALPTDTFTILQTQAGFTTTVANNMPVANIPATGFHTTVKNGSKYEVNFAGAIYQPIVNNGQGQFVVAIVLTNKGNVTVDSLQISLLGTKLGDAPLSSAPAPVTNLAPGQSATLTLTFPIIGALAHAHTAPLTIMGTYSAGALSGNWSVPFRSVALPLR